MNHTPESPITEILPPIRVVDAILLFRRLGVDVTGMGPDQVNAARRNLMNRHHPDRGGNLDTAQNINSAYDLLKNGVPTFRASVLGLKSFCRAHPSRREQVAALKLCYPEHPEWAWAGCSDAPLRPKIYSNDFTDVNFIKKTIWELSGQSPAEYTVCGFDGRQFRSHVVVFGSPKTFDYMADAMIMCQTRGSYGCDCRAVFVQEEESKDLYLIYSDRKYYGNRPIKLRCCLDREPWDDWEFVQDIPAKLDELRV